MPGPRPTAAELRSHATFTALMWALSYPGRPQPLPDGGAPAMPLIAEALVDLETSWFTNDPDLRAALARTGGMARPVTEALYQFYPALDGAALDALAAAPAGSDLYPDESATLVIGCALGAGPALRLRGPGIPDVATLRVGGLPAAFWPLRAQVCRFPLGWDVLLVAGRQVVGLPRTTRIEVL
jgi:alpha-D-ribose 1-methylphosphonate 5-triphosphate synthase subunit PhnH